MVMTLTKRVRLPNIATAYSGDQQAGYRSNLREHPMDSRLLALIREYQSAVKAAVGLMVESGISLPRSNDEWAKTRVAGRGVLAGGIRFRKHGYGCEVLLTNRPVDFDFGAKGEYDGFDLWRLTIFAKGRLAEFEISSEDELERLFKAAVHAGILRYSGYVLYYLQRRPFGVE